MAARILFLASLLLAGVILSAAGSCPTFSCNAGDSVPGQFYYQETWTQDYYWETLLTANQIANPSLSCYNICKAQTNPAYSYWMYEQLTDKEHFCYCFPTDACAGNHFSSTAFVADQDYISIPGHDGRNYIVGKNCASNITGDPHFVGADGSRYDFSGIPDKSFTLLSDAHVHVNAYFGGRFKRVGQGFKALTWMRKVAVMWGHHAFVFEARVGAQWTYGNGYMQSITVDGERVGLSHVGDKASLVDDKVVVSWVEARKLNGDDLVDVYELAIRGVIRLRLTLRPEVKVMRTRRDGLVHFSVDIVESHLSKNVHGVLGQTYRPDFSKRLSSQKLVYSNLLKAMVVPGDNAEGFLDGKVEDYMVSDLLKADSKFSHFVRAEALDEDTSRFVEMSRNAAASKPRKALVATA